MNTLMRKKITLSGLTALALGCAAISVGMVSAAEQAGTFKEGFDVGKRNGGLIAERVYKKLMGNGDCSGLNQYQRTLNLVAARVRPAGGAGTQFTAGFFRGYVEALKQSVKGARDECRALRFTDGAYPGEFFANIFCRVAEVDPAALSLIQEDGGFAAIYDGWSDGQQTRDACAEAFQAVAGECAGVTGIAAELLGVAQAASCADSVL